MKKILFTSLFSFLFVLISTAQTEDVNTLHETAKSFMRSGDFDNAIVVLNKALALDKKDIELQKDMVMCYYLKRDYAKALDGVKILLDRDDADVVVYQMAGNVYKALEQPKDCEKVYKKGLKKFPKSGPLYSEYGELLWSSKDYSAINQWEKGIEVDPAYSGNYYNAALFYFFTKDKVWGLLYGEIFVNMESLSERGTAMKEMLLRGYKEKLFTDADVMKDQDKNMSDFTRTYLQEIGKLSSLVSKGVTTETLIMVRTRFILDWYDNYATKFPFRLFDYQRQLLQEGMFDAYNEWLFAPTENLAAYDNWTKTHEEEYNSFSNFQKSRVFRMPPGQYYQSK